MGKQSRRKIYKPTGSKSRKHRIAQEYGGLCPCRKVAYRTLSEARRAIKAHRARHGGKDDELEKLEVYECRLLPGSYHIGHSRPPRSLAQPNG